MERLLGVLRAAGIVVTAVTVGSCGGSDSASTESFGESPPDPFTCPQFTPCGGDLTGQWNRDSFCVSTIQTGADACYNWSEWAQEKGPVSFQSDGSFTQEISDYSISYDSWLSGCFADSYCAGGGGTNEECSVSNDGTCICKKTQGFWTSLETPPTGPATWRVSGTQLFITYNTNNLTSTEVWDYCVEGNEASFHEAHTMPDGTNHNTYWHIHR